MDDTDREGRLQNQMVQENPSFQNKKNKMIEDIEGKLPVLPNEGEIQK